MPRTTTLAVLLVSVCLIVGCSAKVVGQAVAAEPASSGAAEPPSSAPPASEPAVGRASEPCELLTGEDVGKHLGIGEVTAESSPGETIEENVTIYPCDYVGDGEPLGVLSISLYDAPGDTEQFLDASTVIAGVKEEGQTAQKDIPGVGEAAVTYEDEDGRYLAAAKIRPEAVVMAIWAGGKNLTVEQLTPMVKQAIDKL